MCECVFVSVCLVWEVLTMCCFYWLMNKELLWVYSREEQNQVGTTKLNSGRKKAESRSHEAAGEGGQAC